jgi:4-hydroxy-tetrahydrodipicolinate synthase
MMSAIGRHVSKLSGYAPALPTPFDADGAVDAAAFERLCERQVQMGATALVVCGTTGEAPTLRPAEHHILVRIAVDLARGQIPVIAGAGCNSTAHAIELTKDAEAGGADAILSVTPYYNKPVQAGLHAHFRAIAESTGLPIILYDVPSRTACALTDNTVAKLAEIPNIIGLKDASADISRPARLRRLVGGDFRLLSGDDATALGFIAQGGHGCISVTSNLAPGLCRNIFLAYRQGRINEARRLADAAGELTAVLFRETSPSPLKYALNLLGLMSPTVRLPLVQPSRQLQAEIAGSILKFSKVYSDHMVGNSVQPAYEPVAVE